MKNLVSLILTFIILILSISVVSATSAVSKPDYSLKTSKDGKYRYTFCYDWEDDDADGYYYIYGIAIKEYIGKDKLPSKYIIPKKVDGYSVQVIGEKAFENRDELQTIVANDSLTLHSEAFYNCENLKSATLVRSVELYPKALGYYYNKKIKDFKINIKKKYSFEDANWDSRCIYYAYDNNFDSTYILNLGDEADINLNCGIVTRLKIQDKKVKSWFSSNPQIVKINNKGKVTLLKKGKATITAKLTDGKVYKKIFNVEKSPAICKYHTPKKISNVTVKKDNTMKLSISGKAKDIDNKYTNTKYAKIISKKSSSTLNIKGIKKGRTTLKVNVNGVNFVLQVKVI